MNWLNIRTSTLRTPEFISSEPVERATWLSVLSYAAEQENAGILRGAALWSDRHWQQTCGVTLQEVRSAVKLLRIVDDDVLVAFYPLDQQHECERKRQGGRAGAAKTNALRASQRSAGKQPGHSHHVPSTPVGSADAKRNRKEKEGNGTPHALMPTAMGFPPDVHPEIPPVAPTVSAPASLPEVSASADEQIDASRAPAVAVAASTRVAHPAVPDASSPPPHRISSPRKTPTPLARPSRPPANQAAPPETPESPCDLDQTPRIPARRDYPQLVENPEADSREQAVSEVARKLKNLVLNCSAVVFTASQMKEAGQLRESRAIGHHADPIINIGDDRITVEKTAEASEASG